MYPSSSISVAPPCSDEDDSSISPRHGRGVHKARRRKTEERAEEEQEVQEGERFVTTTRKKKHPTLLRRHSSGFDGVVRVLEEREGIAPSREPTRSRDHYHDNTESNDDKQRLPIHHTRFGFAVLGTGLGHITQGINLCKLLSRHGVIIPTFVIMSALPREQYNHDHLQRAIGEATELRFFPMYTTAEHVQTMNLSSYRAFVKDLMSGADAYAEMEARYHLDAWVSLMCPMLFSPLPTISITSQVVRPNCSLWCLMSLIKRPNELLVGIRCDNEQYQIKSAFPLLYAPQDSVYSLINEQYLDRSLVKRNLCLAYSVSGERFPRTLAVLASRYPEIDFIYFTKDRVNDQSVGALPNVQVEPPSPVFKTVMSRCAFMLTTAGNESVQEAVYNEIPIAIMAAHPQHYEQTDNENRWVGMGFAIRMTPFLDLQVLRERDMSTASTEMATGLKQSPATLLRVINTHIEKYGVIKKEEEEEKEERVLSRVWDWLVRKMMPTRLTTLPRFVYLLLLAPYLFAFFYSLFSFVYSFI